MLKNDAKIIAYLNKRAAPTRTRDIAKHTKIPYQSILRSLKRLEELRAVRSIFGPGHSRLYFLPEHLPEVEEEITSGPLQSRPVDLLGALNVFQNHKLPKFVETGTYKYYAQAVAGVFKHAVDVMYGAAPDENELNFRRQGLEYYKEQLEAHLRGIQSILDTKELWDERVSPHYLIEPFSAELQEISDKAIRALEENK